MTDALLALRADESVELTAAYLRAGYDRAPLVQTLADGRVQGGQRPAQPGARALPARGLPAHARRPGRDRLLLACAKHTAGHRKYGDPLECYRRFAEAFDLEGR